MALISLVGRAYREGLLSKPAHDLFFTHDFKLESRSGQNGTWTYECRRCGYEYSFVMELFQESIKGKITWEATIPSCHEVLNRVG